MSSLTIYYFFPFLTLNKIILSTIINILSPWIPFIEFLLSYFQIDIYSVPPILEKENTASQHLDSLLPVIIDSCNHYNFSNTNTFSNQNNPLFGLYIDFDWYTLQKTRFTLSNDYIEGIKNYSIIDWNDKITLKDAVTSYIVLYFLYWIFIWPD